MKNLAQWWYARAKRLSQLEHNFRTQNIAISLASAYRQGWAERYAKEAPDLQERIRAFVNEAGGSR